MNLIIVAHDNASKQTAARKDRPFLTPQNLELFIQHRSDFNKHVKQLVVIALANHRFYHS